ncbi:Peptidoglycan/LPS O-acetylase OafA/YrhL, contains acyltransferase and SGNH-hydrolase domains [Aureimonas altamirensis DSM 21988]|uniref:Peptidoglycan/LPS O-acetylase OafA/YrhL, contains acyltransferase and SGNH-hydrolase domains n=1 Tax=Aureimonas altamirensis DSM 21988 TaxID=1121026 RepID=A0ABY1I5J1_9HYPH|nr:acyltransferase [Aureimonas altamirensis]SHI63150.1 Peptidoglycan/LPS O-acetylase OafA/YrhL, contains acyltransferase and SGNH-hydrolase domains [Aureimonas altamirensis DSM 21988]
MQTIGRAKHRNVNIQWMRALAALAVAIYHISHYIAFEFDDRRFADIFDGKFGLLGVAIFFAISGALMADLLHRTPPTLFLAHRLVRIYPLFILVFVVVAFIRTGELDADVRAMSLALVGTRVVFELNIEWTLVLEVFFYVILFLLAVAAGARFVVPFAIAWLAAIGVASIIDPEQMGNTLSPTLLQAFFLPGNAAFAGGLLIPTILRQGRVQPIWAVIALGLGAVTMSVDLAYGRIVGSLAAVILVAMVYGVSTKEPKRGSFGWAAERLGDYSYALYLIHVPVTHLVLANLQATPAVLWAACVGAALAVSVPLGMLDISLYRRLRKHVDGANARRLAAVIWLYVAAYSAVGVIFIFKQ